MVRSFVAIELPEEVKSFVGAVANDLRRVLSQAKWVNPQGIHLTLKFLGDVAATAIPEVVKALEKPLSIRGPIQLGLEGLGCFPNIKRPRIVWVGITDKQSVLGALVKDIEDALIPLGFSRETRTFSPHLTLARIRTGQELSKGIDLITERQRLVGPAFYAAGAVLFKSVLKSQGAEYHVIKRFDFLTC